MNLVCSKRHCLLLTCTLMVSFFSGAQLAGEEVAEKEPTAVSIAGGKISLQAPGEWVKKQPRSRIVEVEFAVPAVEGDEKDGRLTIMRAGGGIDANIDRWIGQFSQPDGKATRERTVIKEEKIAGQDVHLVDISGTFSDRPGPFAPAVQRENYRMLSAIVVTENHGQQFVKLYGPRKTIAANEKAFIAFIQSLKVQE